MSEAADVACLEEAYAAMTAAGDDCEAFAGPDRVFHLSILHAAGNELLGSLGSALELALSMSIRLSIANPGGHRHSLSSWCRAEGDSQP